MNKRTSVFLAAAVLATTFAAGYLLRGGAGQQAPNPATPTVSARTRTQGGAAGQPASAAPPTGATAGRSTARTPAPALSETERNKLLDELNAAATTYDAAQLTTIEPFLKHGDAEVRAAAIDAVLTLGDASGAAILRAAAKQAEPKDAEAMLKAAAYLDLPPVRMRDLVEQRRRHPRTQHHPPQPKTPAQPGDPAEPAQPGEPDPAAPPPGN